MAERVKVLWNDWKEYLRQPCEVYTRIMWYLRPISQANIWKKSEMYSRKNFKEWCVCPRNFDRVCAMLQDNRDFITKYMTYETA